MHAQQQAIAIRRQFHEVRAKQRFFAEVEQVTRSLAAALPQLLEAADRRAMQRYSRRLVYYLDRRAVDLDNPRSQRLVTLHQLINAALQSPRIQLPLQKQWPTDVVGCARTLEPIEEPQALLR